jgi:transcriptional regulator with XRE-family HTH domain
MTRRKFSELKKSLTPARRRRIDAAKRELLVEMYLHEVRKLLGLSQVELAARLDVSQASVSQFENQDDMTVTTLRRIIEALGGRLEITVEFPKQNSRIRITQFDDAA